MQDEIHVLKKQLYEVRLFVHPPHVKCKCVCVVDACVCMHLRLIVSVQMHVCAGVCLCVLHVSYAPVCPSLSPVASFAIH